MIIFCCILSLSLLIYLWLSHAYPRFYFLSLFEHVHFVMQARTCGFLRDTLVFHSVLFFPPPPPPSPTCFLYALRTKALQRVVARLLQTIHSFNCLQDISNVDQLGPSLVQAVLSLRTLRRKLWLHLLHQGSETPKYLVGWLRYVKDMLQWWGAIDLSLLDARGVYIEI